jgi:hypothetical protein
VVLRQLLRSPLPDLLDFCEQYKRRIGDPFYLLASPGITEEKYEACVDAGLLCIRWGSSTAPSASEDVQAA